MDQTIKLDTRKRVSEVQIAPLRRVQSDAVGDKSVAVGIVSKASGDFSTSIGLYASSDGKYSTAEGVASNSVDERTTAIGAFAQSVKAAATAIGANTAAVGNYSTAIGVGSSTCSSRCVAIGMNAAVNGPKVPDPNVLEFSPSGTDSVALGSFSVADDYSTVSVGNDVDGIDHYYRATDNDGHTTTVAPFWAKKTVELPARYRHIKRRIIHVAEPIDGHNAATKHYVDTNTSNALVGTAKDTLVHVDDAFSGASLRGITVEGACRQDGTPSPDSPVPIEVIENPTVKMCGRTLCSIDELHSFYYNIINYNNTRALDKYVGLQVTVSLDFTSSIDLGGDVRVYGYQNYGIGFDTVKSTISYKSVKAGQTYHYRYTDKLAKLGQSFSNFGSIIVYPMEQADRDKRPKIIVTNFRIECGGTETPYEPYTEQSATFTLPSEHPYLAKLPNGTADEITVDEEGNVELVARVERVLPSDYRQLDFGDGGDGSAYVSLRKNHASISVNSLMCSSYTPSNPTIKSGFIYTPNYTNIVIRDDRFTSKDKAIELLDGVVVYTAVEPTRYPLGRIEMPKTQDSIVNVWTDAEVTPNTAIEYVRDVNIVVANIESAIASITEG